MEQNDAVDSRFGGVREMLISMRRSLAGAFGVMIMAVVLAGALNYLFNMVMARMLPKSDFGDLYSLLAIFLMVMMGAVSIQTVVAKYVAEFTATGGQQKIRILVQSFSRWLIWVGVITVVVCSAAAWPIGRAMHLKSPWYVVILGTAMALALYVTLPFGLLQGEQRFIGLGLGQIGYAVVRIILGVILVLLGLGVSGAIGVGTISYVIVIAAIVYYYRGLFTGRLESVEDFHPTHALKYLVPVAVATSLIILMAQIDVVLVKILIPAQAGAYSYGSLAGKAVLFFPDGISMVMFPRVSELRALGRPTKRVLVLSLVAVAAMVAVVAAFYAIFPDLTALIFAGTRGKEIAHLVGMFGLVMAVFAVVKVLVYYLLALEKKGFILIIVTGAVMEIIGISLFHRSLLQVLYVMLIVGVFLLIPLLVMSLRGEPGDGGLENFSNSTYVPNKI